MAGYVPSDELDRIIATQPAPAGGLVVWENFTWRPRRRLGMRILIGPSVRLGLIPAAATEQETVRRQEAYAASREIEERRYEAETLERDHAREAERAARVEAREWAHEMVILDWEIAQAFRSWRAKSGDAGWRDALRTKYLDELPRRELHTDRRGRITSTGPE